LNKNNNIVLFIVFLLLSAAIFLVGTQYKNYKINEYTFKKYSSIASSLSNEVSTLINEKKNATLAIAISFSKSQDLKEALLKHSYDLDVLSKYSRELQESTDFKNVWIQLIDKNGISLSRNWTKKHGDDLSLIREDVRSMNNKPQIKSSISVGRFDMSFKAMVPIYDKSTQYIGFLEVVTHFNSIAKKIKMKKFEPVILVDEKYKDQILHPFSGIYSNNNYVANVGANKKLVEYIAQKGLKNFISPHKNYIIDKEKGDIVVNYTLFDSLDEPMANFLMFKPLSDIDMSSVESMKYTIELFVLLSIVLSAVFFYFISNKDEIKIETDSSINIAIFVIFFIVISFLYYLLLSWNFEKKKETFFKQYNYNIKKDYEIIHNKFSTVAKMMFHTAINKPEVLELVKRAYISPEEKNISREKLYKLLVGDYEYFKTHELRQLHFHLKDNESFLRFHRPNKYGDSLLGIRDTVEWTNKNLQAIEGFEEGRIFNGFRYVFPLFYKQYTGESQHIGSVETSFSAYAIATEFAKTHNTKASFIINEDVVKNKVFKEEQSNYVNSPFKGFMYEDSIKSQFEHSFIQVNIDLLDKHLIDLAAKKIAYEDVFSLQSKDENMLFTFLPLKNPVSNKVVASIVLQLENHELNEQDKLYIIFLLSGITAILFAMLYIYKEFSLKHKFRILSQKTQKILDAQNSIVIVTNGKNILDGNKKLLDYFGYKNLEDFKSEHNCICEFFEEDDRFFHLGKISENESWIEEIDQLSYKEHIVAMKDFNNKQNIFIVSVSDFGEKYILSFSNISDTMTEHFSLMERVVHDKLTGAYNRDYFENRKDLWIQELAYKELQLGVVILDIDHFKDVNDTYGHNVGDMVLRHLVSLIHTTIRQEDTLIRWGGEEFLIVSYVSSLDNLHRIAENIRKRVDNESFEEVGNLSASFGITLYREKEDILQTIERADKALYKAKRSGRNIVVSS
jgi:diguanylate cyclase (GGDEF)-like protein